MEHKELTVENVLVEGAKSVSCPLSEKTIQAFLIYLNELIKWNERINLTGLNKKQDMVIELFVDSLACGMTLGPQKNENIIDIGSGGGFPGIPLKIVYPELKVTLVEPRLKKTAFLHHIIGTLRLKDIKVVSSTVEEISKDSDFQLIYDRIFARAIKTESVLPDGRVLLGHSGKIVLSKAQKLEKCEKNWGVKIDEEMSYELPMNHGKRVLTILKPI